MRRFLERVDEDVAVLDRVPASLIDFEVTSAVRGLTLGGKLSGTRAVETLTDFEALPIRRWPGAAALRLRAFGLRENLSACDAAYAVLAEALRCPLLTRDVRWARTRGHDVDIRAR